MSIYGNPIMLGGGGGGGGGTIVPKTITQDGTYYASADNADGYNPVIVSVGSGILDWDFTSQTPSIDRIRGASITSSGITWSNGAVYDLASDYLKLNALNNKLFAPLTIELDISSMSLTSGDHRRFIMGTTANGFIYRSNGKWAFYNGSWQESSETDGSFFANSTVKVVVDTSNKWHIYKNGELWWEPSGAQALSDTYIGSTSQSINNAVITGLRIS